MATENGSAAATVVCAVAVAAAAALVAAVAEVLRLRAGEENFDVLNIPGVMDLSDLVSSLSWLCSGFWLLCPCRRLPCSFVTCQKSTPSRCFFWGGAGAAGAGGLIASWAVVDSMTGGGQRIPARPRLAPLPSHRS